MRILMLCEGNGEAWDSWSGITKSIVDHLRLDGHEVRVEDVDLYGRDRYLAAALTFSPNRRRWGTRYHLGGASFRLKSRRARQHVVSRLEDPIDAIVRIGATFETPAGSGIPYFLCCDSNIRVAERGRSSGYSDAAALTDVDVEAVAERERRVYGAAAGIFPLSENLRRSFIDDFGIPAERVRAIYAGPNLDLSRVPPRASRPAASDPTVLFVGRQWHRKGGDVLVESLRSVRRRLPAARLVVAGPKPDGFDEPWITYLGDLDKNQPAGLAALVEAFASADVFALPTRFEPFGIAYVEAMHFGLPCVGPSAWAVPEIIADGETGFTVPVDDVETLADRLFRLLSDPALARTMGEAGRERAARLFTWPHVVERMVDTMTGVIQRNVRAA